MYFYPQSFSKWLEELEEEELDRIRSFYGELAENARRRLREGADGGDTPPVRLS